MKIKVRSCEVKTQNEKYTIYKVTDETGAKYDCFEELEAGKEYEGDIKENPPYGTQFKVKKERKFGPGKDYSFEKKRVALECAASLVAAGKIPVENLTEARDKFFKYMNE